MKTNMTIIKYIEGLIWQY